MSKRQFFIIIFLSSFLSSLFGASLCLFAKNTTYPPRTIREELEFFSQSLDIIMSNYVTDIPVGELIESSVKGMLERLDPYSVYFDSVEFARMQENTSGNFGGLGIEIGIRGTVLTVIAPMDNTPAERAGLVAGDQILEIDGESTEGITTEEAVNKLRGIPGTQVKIRILHPGQSEPVDITITREIIHLNSVPYAEMIPGTDIGYIRLSNFYSDAGKEVYDAVKTLSENGAKKFILDLRGNPGGLLRESIDISNIFLPKGSTIVSTNGRAGRNRFFSEREPLSPSSPLIVLVNFSSASASEIIGGAIQDHDRGLIMGSRTYGKGSVQSIFPLYRGSRGAIKLTTSRYYTPSGRLIDAGHSRTKSQIENNISLADSGPYVTVGPLRRNVCGGGGIYPDFLFYSSLLSDEELSLVRMGLYFTFATEYTLENPSLSRDFELSRSDLDRFYLLAADSGIFIDESTPEEIRKNIISQLRITIATSSFGADGRYYESLKSDEAVEVAVRLLKETESMRDIFTVAQNRLEWQRIDERALAYEDSIRSIIDE
ncbi:S41 family peptidase [candidate division WOR-3 bacterium]|nr:S41 family peptidase [candidate division WOR-3 bacterium]